VEKRRYQKGFYVARSGATKKTTKKEKAAAKPVSSPLREEVQGKVHTEPLYASASQKQEPQQVTSASKKDLAKPPDDSCDVIMLRNGETVRARVTEIGLSEIRYWKCTMQDGPLFVVLKAEVLKIRYHTGREESFSQETGVPATDQEYVAPPVPRKKHPGVNITVIFTILGWVLFFGSIPAIISGFVSLAAINNHPEKYTEEGRTTLIICIIASFLKLVLLGSLLFFASTGHWPFQI
jgi:hypothetical protein